MILMNWAGSALDSCHMSLSYYRLLQEKLIGAMKIETERSLQKWGYVLVLLIHSKFLEERRMPKSASQYRYSTLIDIDSFL